MWRIDTSPPPTVVQILGDSMIGSSFNTVCGATAALAICTLAWIPSHAAPLPKELPRIRVKLAGEMKIPDLAIEHAAIIGEAKLVVVGTKAHPVVEEPDFVDSDKLNPNGAILDLDKKSHRSFTNDHTARICTVSSSGNRIVTASNSRDPTVRIWDHKTDKSVAEIKVGGRGETNAHYGAACFHKGDRIAIATPGGVMVLDPTKPDIRTVFDPPEGSKLWVNPKLIVSVDDARIACEAGTGHIAYWDVASKKPTALSLIPEKTKEEDQWRSGGVVFGAKGMLLAWRINSSAEVPETAIEAELSGSRRGVVQIDTIGKKVVPLKMGQAIHTMTCAIDPTETWLATGGYSRPDKPLRNGNLVAAELRIYHMPTGTLVHRNQMEDGPLMWLAFTPSGKRIVAATADGVVRWWDVESK